MSTTTVKAVHRISFSDEALAAMGRPAKSYVEPGEVFPCSDSELAWLMRAGAVTNVKAKTAVEAAKTALEPEGDEPNDVEITAEPELIDLSNEDLAAKAKSFGIKVTKAMKRDTLIAKIELAQSADDGDTGGSDEADNLV